MFCLRLFQHLLNSRDVQLSLVEDQGEFLVLLLFLLDGLFITINLSLEREDSLLLLAVKQASYENNET